MSVCLHGVIAVWLIILSTKKGISQDTGHLHTVYRIAGLIRGRIFSRIIVRETIIHEEGPSFVPRRKPNYNSAKYGFVKFTISSHSLKYLTAK